MRKSLINIIMIGMSVFTLAGCNSKDVSITAEKAKNNEVIIAEDGKVQGVIKESFDKKYYKEEELETFITEDLDEFNKENNTKIKINSMQVKEDNIYVVMDYKSIDEYNAYNEYKISSMEVDIAKDNKLVPDKLTVYGKDKKENKYEALDKDKKVVVIQEKTNVETSDVNIQTESKVDIRFTVAGKIKYVSGAKKDDANTAKIKSLQKPVIIVYE